VHIFFTFMGGPRAEWESAFLPIVRDWFARQKQYPFELTDDPEKAGLIVFLESNSFKTQEYIWTLCANQLLNRFPNKCFTINYEDTPAGFLPGLYTSLSRTRQNPMRQRTWSYVFRQTKDLVQTRDSWTNSPKLLFSFRGSPNSHSLRQRLLGFPFRTSNAFRLTGVARWFDHTAAEREDYLKEILDSHFCLCPRGIGPASIRLFEVMALGRCPVILADDWAPIVGIDWKSCSIRIPESEIETIPEILETRLEEAPALGAAALSYWERFFSPEEVIGQSLNQLVQLVSNRNACYDERNFQKLWKSRAFYRTNGWTIEQRCRRKFSRFWKTIRLRATGVS
jgi:hypothetical protein